MGVTMLDKIKAVVCCLLGISAIMLSEKKKRKRKMCSKKWYLKRNISCDAHLLNELLETDVPWDDAIVVWAGKLRKLWDSLSELRNSVYKRQLERAVLRAALLPVKTAQFTQFFRQVWRHTVKSLGLTDSVQGALLLFVHGIHIWSPHEALCIVKLPLWPRSLKVRPHRTRSAAADCGLCPLRNVTF